MTRTHWILCVAVLAAISGARAPHAASHAASDDHELPPALLPALAEHLQRAAGEAYTVTPLAGNAARRDEWRAANPAHDLAATFTHDGVVVRRSHGQGEALTLALRGYGAADRVQPLTMAGWTSNGTRVQREAGVMRARPTASVGVLTEWYVNSPLGLEQGFTLHRAPLSDATEAILDLEIAGATSASVIDGGTAVELGVTGHAGDSLRYGHLDAWDASGRRLATRLTIGSRDARSTATADRHWIRLHVDTHQAHYPITVDPLLERARLFARNTAASRRAGWSVALDGDTALVGAPFVGPENAGAVYVFTRNGPAGWVEQATLTADVPEIGIQFGWSVAVDGDTALIGAPFASGATSLSGAAYVFERSGGVWSQTQKLTTASDGVGWSVALDGDTALVGARADSRADALSGEGAAFVFVRNGTWSQHVKLIASDAAAGDVFGTSVALDGDTAIIGAPLADVDGNGNAGAAYVFVRNGPSWSQQAKVTAGLPAPNAQFGASVALDGETAIAGAPFATVDGSANAGAASVFVRGSSGWLLQSTLTGSGPQAIFGTSVAISGDTVLIGAPNFTRDRTGEGAAHVFLRRGGTWMQHTMLFASDPQDGASFGKSVAIEGATVLAGAPNKHVGPHMFAGVTYVFGDAPPVLPALEGTVAPEDSAGISIALTITDDDPLDALTLTATSSNPSLVPPSGLVLTGSGGHSTLAIVPLADQTGTTLITVTATNGVATTSEVFPLFVTSVDDPPLISAIAPQTIAEDTSTGVLSFSVTDIDPDILDGDLLLTAMSSNRTLVPVDRIVLGGSGAMRTMAITPAADETGTTTITLFAGNGSGMAARAFDVTVTPVDDAPTISMLADWTTDGTSTPPLPFTIGDVDTRPDALVVSGASSNVALVPHANIVISGSGAARTVVIVPAINQIGTATITLTVTDGRSSASTSFTLTVVASNDAPTVSAIADQTTTDGEPLPSIPITVTDRETSHEALVLLAQSSNPALVSPDGLVFGGTGTARTLTVHPIAGQTGTTIIRVFVGDGVAMASAAFTLTVEPAAASTTYLLAEGATGPFFDLDVLLANPHPTPVPVTLTFLPETGAPRIEQRTLAPQSRTTLRVDALPGLAHAAVSTLVTAPAHLPIVVERTMGWDASGYGAHTEKATAGAAPEWFFAEGAQGFFSTYVLLVNPHDAPNTAHVTWLREGEPALVRAYPLPPHARVTVDAGAEPALVDRAFGAHVRFERPGAAERAMYFGPGFAGGHASAGVPAPARRWFLAEGATGSFFMTFLLLANPQAVDATVTLTYLTDTGIPVVRTHTVPAAQRRTINIALEDPALASAAVATDVASTVPIVVERTQYWPQPRWTEAHNSFGETATAVRWGLAEGGVGGPHARQTFLLLANPGSEAATVTITFLRTTGAPVIKTVGVPPASRVTIAITGPDSEVPELADEDFGAVLDATQPIAVERALYSNANGVVWAAGTNATGTRLP